MFKNEIEISNLLLINNLVSVVGNLKVSHKNVTQKCLNRYHLHSFLMPYETRLPSKFFLNNTYRNSYFSFNPKYLHINAARTA